MMKYEWGGKEREREKERSEEPPGGGVPAPWGRVPWIHSLLFIVYYSRAADPMQVLHPQRRQPCTSGCLTRWSFGFLIFPLVLHN